MIVLKPEGLSDNQEFGTDFIGVLLNRNRRISISADSRFARTVNVSLFPANGFTGSSEISRMVKNAEQRVFKVRQRHLAASGFDLLELTNQFFVLSVFSVNSNSFVEADQVRRSMDT